MRYHFLQHDFDRLQALIAVLEGRKASTLADIGGASEQSSETWHDNPMFDEVHQLAKMWQNQLAKLQEFSNNAVVVPISSQTKVVEIGNRVNYRYSNGSVDEIIVGSYVCFGRNESTADADVASSSSPIGSALLGCRVGDTATITFYNEQGMVTRETKVEVTGISLPK